jgi:hypothetical protein
VGVALAAADVPPADPPLAEADVPCETGLSVPCAVGVPLEQPAAPSAASATMPRSMLPGRLPRRAGGAAGRRDVVDSVIRFPP